MKDCGVLGVNGRYKDDGRMNGKAKYTKIGVWCGENVVFGLHIHSQHSTPRKWHISVLKNNGDVQNDIYWAFERRANSNVPPSGNWNSVTSIYDPAPKVLYSMYSNKI